MSVKWITLRYRCTVVSEVVVDQEVLVESGADRWMQEPWDTATVGPGTCACGALAVHRIRVRDGKRPACDNQECKRAASRQARSDSELLQRVGDGL